MLSTLKRKKQEYDDLMAKLEKEVRNSSDTFNRQKSLKSLVTYTGLVSVWIVLDSASVPC